jgi:hypothetical protein
MSQKDTFSLLVEEIALALAPLRNAISSPDRFTSFMAELGWRVDNIPQPLKDLGGGLAGLITVLQRVMAREETGEEISPADIEQLLLAVRDVQRNQGDQRRPRRSIPGLLDRR